MRITWFWNELSSCVAVWDANKRSCRIISKYKLYKRKLGITAKWELFPSICDMLNHFASDIYSRQFDTYFVKSLVPSWKKHYYNLAREWAIVRSLSEKCLRKMGYINLLAILITQSVVFVKINTPCFCKETRMNFSAVRPVTRPGLEDASMIRAKMILLL